MCSMRVFQIMEYIGSLHWTSLIIWSFHILLFVFSSSAQFDECSSSGHRVIEDPYRSRSYRLESDRDVAGICDMDMARGWYVFKLYGKFAEMPTECVNAGFCGTSSPMWLNTNGQSLPLPGQNKTFVSCATLVPRMSHPKHRQQNCYGFCLPVTVRNCGDFYVYFLSPAPACSVAYCLQESKQRCKPSEFSIDGFAPCNAKYPTVKNTPSLSVAIRDDDAYLNCSFESSTTDSSETVLYQIKWYKAKNEQIKELLTTETNKTIAFLPIKAHIQMGDKIFCEVQAFFSNTKEWKSPAVESKLFKAEIRISSKYLELVENGESQKVVFESSIPVLCDRQGPCSIKIPLSVDKDEHNLHPDLAISECFVEIKSRKCSKRNCGKGVVYIKAVTDFVGDGDRVSIIRTGEIESSNSIFNGYTVDDITVSVKDVPGAQCYSFTDPHFITFDRLKYDFYKTGTYILHKSLNRDFEVNSRIWNCGGATEDISCNCGFVARENNDVISVDMCNGVLLETKPEVKIKSPLPLADGVEIKESKSGSKITVSFPSGAFVRGDISEWGMSISVQVPSSDFNRTCGLCGTFDGDPSNDYHYTEQNKMDVEMKFGQVNEFVDLWRLRDGGLFNNLPDYKEYPKRRRFCNCERAPGSTLRLRKCTRYDDVKRSDIIKTKDMTTKYKAKSSTRRKRSLVSDEKHDLKQSQPVRQHEEYYFYPDDHDSDLRPVTPTWPTPTGITEVQALEVCEKRLTKSTLAGFCSKVTGSEMYIKDAVEMCVADLQLTDDFRWDLYAYNLIENECERALLENQTMWMQNDDASVNNRNYLQKSLNCPYNCSGNGKCTLLGCVCDAGFSSVDCSIRHNTPTITRAGDNGLCDRRAQICDVIKVNVVKVKKSDSIRCHITLLNINGEDTEFDTTGSFSNKQTLFCPMPEKKIEGTHGPMKWALQVSFNGGSLSNAVIVTIFDSSCFRCDWQGFCNLTIESCFIEQTCRSVGETSPTNDCLICIPNLNIYGWSIKEDNLVPVFLRLPPPLFIFTGNTLNYQLKAIDRDGDIIVYDLIWKEDGISLSTDGRLLWQPVEAKQVLIPVSAADRCGATSTTMIEVTVIDCPCKNGGKCGANEEYKQADPVCICRGGFQGPHCEHFAPYDLVADICKPNPCLNGSCSLSIDGSFDCQCDVGYTGLLCDQLLNPCNPNPCFEGVECRVTADRFLPFSCGACPHGYEGDGIACSAHCTVSCPENMRCTADNQCVCEQGWTGFGCKIAVCRPDCQNGFCVAPNVCSCFPGYSGELCDKAICKPSCKHGGLCYAPNVCVCPSGYVGAHCETLTCRLNCQNGGYCSDPDTCVCPEGYSGPTCSQAVCQPDCMNGGSCAKPSLCLCPRGYQGQHCQRGVCHDTCLNGGRCVRKDTCSCPSGFIGRQCQIPVCEPRCLNSGRCVAPNTCSCASGWRGRHCQKAICNSGCRNNGVCIKPNVCACQQGYGGTSCQTPLCHRPCMYGGRCIEPDRCTCRHGYTGKYCEQRSNDRYKRQRRHYR